MIDFVLCDVFGVRTLSGNPLAVFFSDGRLTDRQMEALTREFNWSEVTFVEPATLEGAAARVRIWTPTGEIPFAGHPTVGTTVVLARTGRIPAGAPAVLQLGVGLTSVEALEVSPRGGRARMRQQRPALGPELPDRAALAAAFGLTAGDMISEMPIQVVSTGLPFLMLPLRTPDLLARLRPDPSLVPDLLRRCGARHPYAFAPDGEGRVRTRMLDTYLEDAATGSAAGALGAYLVRMAAARPGEIRVAQGQEMGRPSEILVEVEGAPDAISAVRVTGQVYIWAEGRLADLPAF